MQVGVDRCLRRLLLASSSFAALLGGGAPPAFAACVNGGGGFNNPSGATVAGICVTNTSFSGSIINQGTISTSGIKISNGTITGKINNSGTITAPTGVGLQNSTITGGITDTGTISASNHGILVDNASSVDAAGVTGISIVAASFAGGISNAGKVSGGAAGVEIGSFQAGTGSIFAGGLTNAGTISGGGTGIAIVNLSTFSGGITNSGTLSGANGLVISGVGNWSGGITNTGQVLGNNLNKAIIIAAVATFSGGITNSGTLSGATGMGIFSSTIAGGITDTGTINGSRHGILVDSASSVAGTEGILIVAASFAGGISNAGNVSGIGGIGVQIGSGQAATGSIFAGGLTNSGTISAAFNTGIGIANLSTFSGGLTNSGTLNGFNGLVINRIANWSGGITNTGQILGNNSGRAILIGGIQTFAGVLTNSGTISGGTGIVVQSPGLTIFNSGMIAGNGGVAIDASLASSAMTINQTGGMIAGAIKLSANADVLNISGGTIAGNIVGAGANDTINFNLGGGTFTYGGAFGFTGINQVNINSGTIVLNGNNNAAAIDVFSGATFGGTGTLDPLALTIHSGATFTPGTPGVAGTSMTIGGNLIFQTGASYQIYVSPIASTSANVLGTASLAGTVNAAFASGTYLKNQYLILQSSGLNNTTFASLNTSNLPAGATAGLSYNADDVFLDLTLPAPVGLNVNQHNVDNGLSTYFNNGGALPPNFASLFGLTGAAFANGLTKLDGETATDAQKGAFQLMTDFLDLMLDPTASGGGGVSSGGANTFAPEQDASLPPEIALAYAMALKAPQPQAPQTFDQRWTAWGSAFGGTSFTDGNAVIGSTNVTASDYGFAAGMETRLTPDTVYGFGLAGGGTNWNLAQGLGNGRSDAFQAGLYAKTHWGPLYLSGALAFANHWFTTNRVALGDQLRASFTGQSYAARFETGYRYAVPVIGAIVGVTPYAALQAQDFHTPNYSETDLTGGGFGLSYASMNATDTRSELGARFDNLQVVDDMPLILRGRLAWAHDWFTGAAALNAVFETLPGSNFTVNGASPPKNSALTTAAAELHITANWTAIAKFDGEFGSGSETYGGTGTLRYTW